MNKLNPQPSEPGTKSPAISFDDIYQSATSLPVVHIQYIIHLHLDLKVVVG